MHSSGEKVSKSPVTTVRRISASDATSVHAILRESPEASVWSVESLRESFSQGIAWAADAEGRVAGVLIGRVAADEFEILNLAVEKAFRRKGIATQLVATALEHALASGVRQTLLEVRASNKEAIAFYSHMRFLQYAVRANYYRDPVEDAVMFVLHTPENNP
jgi:ribosomal-protein-alanine acetyltransferase